MRTYNIVHWNKVNGTTVSNSWFRVKLKLVQNIERKYPSWRRVSPGMGIFWKRTVSAEFRAIRFSTKFPRKEIRWNFGILRSGSGAFKLKFDKICPVTIMFLLIALSSFYTVKLTVSLVNVNNSADNCRFIHIY